MSHHYSGPQFGFARGDARLDLTDFFAFPKPNDNLSSILIMNVHPSTLFKSDERTTSIPFAPNALYEFRIDANNDDRAELTYQLTFSEFGPQGQTGVLRSVQEGGAAKTLIENAPV